MSFKLKTILGIALIEALLLLLLVSMTLDYLRSSNYDALTKHAQTTAALFATTTKDAVLSYDLASLESFVDEVLKNPELSYARVLGPLGEAFAHGGDAQILQRPFVADRLAEDALDGIYDTYANIEEAGELYGRVEIGLNIAPIVAVINEAERRSAVISVIEMALVALFSFILGSYLTSQLKSMTAAAKAISKGDYDINVPVKGSDELAEVAHSFNLMADNLKRARARRQAAELALKELNSSLEQQVERRTELLEKRNRQLTKANSEIKTAQAQLLHSEKMASLGVLAAGVAHEINNPMSYMISNLDTLRDYLDSYQRLLRAYREQAQLSALEEELDIAFIDEDIQQLLTDTRAGSLKIKDIVKGLKEFSHFEQQEAYIAYDLNKCVESTLKIAQNQLKYHCQIHCELSPLPEIDLSVSQLNQVILNFLINAGQAIERDGQITIATGSDAQWVWLSITDNGKGIDAATLPHIFEPFYTTKPVGEGSGLGLSISYGIIQDHGGSIEVTSEVNCGTCFTIKLPVASINRKGKEEIQS